MNSDSNYEEKKTIDNKIKKEQINTAALIIAKYNNVSRSIIDKLNNIHNDYALNLYTLFDNLSLALKTNQELNTPSSISTRFVPFIYQYPCHDAIIARIFEINNHLNNLFYIMSELSFKEPEILDYLHHVFKKANIVIEEIQALLQKINLKACRDDAIMKSVVFSNLDETNNSDDYYETPESENEYE